jgi:hypothetical protein
MAEPSSLLAQRAVADDSRWTRAVEANPTISSWRFSDPLREQIRRGESREVV